MDDTIIMVGKRLIVLEARNLLTPSCGLALSPSTDPSTCSRDHQAWPGWAVGPGSSTISMGSTRAIFVLFRFTPFVS